MVTYRTLFKEELIIDPIKYYLYGGETLSGRNLIRRVEHDVKYEKKGKDILEKGAFVVEMPIYLYSELLVNPDLATQANLERLQQKITDEFTELRSMYLSFLCSTRTEYLHYERVLNKWIWYTTDTSFRDEDKAKEFLNECPLNDVVTIEVKVVEKQFIIDIVLSHPYTKLINDMFDGIITQEYLSKVTTLNTIQVFTDAIREYEKTLTNPHFIPILMGQTLMLNYNLPDYEYETLTWADAFLRFGPYIFDELVEKTACWVPFQKRINIHNITYWK